MQIQCFPFEKGGGSFDTTLTIYLKGTSYARPYSGERSLEFSASAVYTLYETDYIKVKTYRASGISVTKSGTTYICTRSYSGGGGTGYAGGNWAGINSGNGYVTFTLTITPPS